MKISYSTVIKNQKLYILYGGLSTKGVIVSDIQPGEIYQWQKDFASWFHSNYKGMKQEDAANAMGIPRSTWGKYLAAPVKVEKLTHATRNKLYELTKLHWFRPKGVEETTQDLEAIANQCGTLGRSLQELSAKLAPLKTSGAMPEGEGAKIVEQYVYRLINALQPYVNGLTDSKEQRDALCSGINGHDVGYLVVVLEHLFGDNKTDFDVWKQTAHFEGYARMMEIIGGKNEQT